MLSPTLLADLNQERLNDITNAQAQRRLAHIAKQAHKQKRETRLSPSQILWLIFLCIMLLR